jgi:hypothetical protein
LILLLFFALIESQLELDFHFIQQQPLEPAASTNGKKSKQFVHIQHNSTGQQQQDEAGKKKRQDLCEREHILCQ